MPTLDELYLAYRQAKVTLFFDRRGVGLLDLAKYESQLEQHLRNLQSILATNGGWFDDLPTGEVWIVPKRLRFPVPSDESVTRIGSIPPPGSNPDLEIQLRLSPSPQAAIVEVLFLWRYGPYLESLLSPNSIGNRLDLRKGNIIRTSRWLFHYWKARYEEFKTAPIAKAAAELKETGNVTVLTADLANFYDTIDPSFLLSDAFIADLTASNHQSQPPLDISDYRSAVASLLGFYASYRHLATRRTGLDWKIGVPIGSITSRVVANLSLATLDRSIESQDGTQCYRRYVDDFVIVAKAGDSRYDSIDDIIRERIPHLTTSGKNYRLDVDFLQRAGSQFSIQNKKCRAYHLAGPDGRRFLTAIRNDYSRLVSDTRAFLDSSVLAEQVGADDTNPVLRVTAPDRTLTVLRDADRPKLHHLATSTKLRSIDRAAVLLDPETARRIASRTLHDLSSFLSSDHNWVDNLDLSLRILGLGITTQSWDVSCSLLRYMDALWGTSESLHQNIRCLIHRGRILRHNSAWTWLRNYLHARRIHAVCGVIRRPSDESSLPSWLQRGILERTRRARPRALIRRALRLAASDLRVFDREDDPLPVQSTKTAPHEYRFGQHDPALKERLQLIQVFVGVCSELGDAPWTLSPPRLFLCTRPPSYFDVARRYLYRTEADGFRRNIFDDLLSLVNAIRGTMYNDPIGRVTHKFGVVIPAFGLHDEPFRNPQIMLGNLVVPEDCFRRAAKPKSGSNAGDPVLSISRLRSVAEVLRRADAVADENSLLVLPELSIPRSWFRAIANHVARRGSYGLVAGLEYLHDYQKGLVYNQAYAVLPGPYHSVAAWPWTKRFPAREESEKLRGLHVAFDPKLAKRRPRRVTVDSRFGCFSVLICSELIETRRVADLLGRVELVVVPAWNRDTASFDHLIQSAGLQLHAIIAVANNGHYSDCRAWAPRCVRWERDLCRLVERDRDGIVSVEIPLTSLRDFHLAIQSGQSSEWQRLPPDWSGA